MTRVSFVKRKKKYKPKFIKEGHCLDDLVKPPMSGKKLRKLFLQDSSDTEEEDDDSSDNTKSKDSKMKIKANAKKLGIKKGVECEHDELGTVVVVSVAKSGTVCTVKDEEGDKSDVGVNELTVASKKDKKAKGKKGKEKPKAKAKGKKGKKSKDEDDDDDDEDDDDEDDDDDSDDDDDEDDDSDDDDDDDSDDDDDDDDDEDEDD